MNFNELEKKYPNSNSAATTAALDGSSYATLRDNILSTVFDEARAALARMGKSPTLNSGSPIKTIYNGQIEIDGAKIALFDLRFITPETIASSSAKLTTRAAIVVAALVPGPLNRLTLYGSDVNDTTRSGTYVAYAHFDAATTIDVAKSAVANLIDTLLSGGTIPIAHD